MRIMIPILVTLCLASLAGSQSPTFVHPPKPLQPTDFYQPPNDGRTHFVGPIIRPLDVKCWYAEPSAPTKPIGGVHGFQEVVVYLPTDDLTDAAHIDNSFRQSPLHFAGGGATSDIKPEDLPPGIFLSFKGHPIYKVLEVKYPSQPEVRGTPSAAKSKIGVTVRINCEHEPTNGECYFYLAAWTAVK